MTENLPGIVTGLIDTMSSNPYNIDSCVCIAIMDIFSQTTGIFQGVNTLNGTLEVF